MTTISKHYARAILDDDIELHVIEVEATLDETFAPYARARIVIGLPGDDILALLDPRTGARITLTLYQEFGDVYMLSALTTAWPLPSTLAEITTAYQGATLATLTEQYRNELNPNAALSGSTRPMNLGVRSLEVDHRTARVTIELASDEAILLDYAPSGTAPIVLGLTSVRDTVEHVLGEIGATLVAGTLDDTVEAEATTWNPGVNGWDFVEPLVQKSGLRLWCDEFRQWRLDETLAIRPGAVVLTQTGTLTEATDTLSRDVDEWCDAVVIRYEWTDGAGARQIAYDSAVAPGGGSKVRLVVKPDTRYPGPGAAVYVLRRTAGKGRVVDVEAINDYLASPGVACVISIPNAPTQTGVISGVTWRQPADEMRIKSRDLTDTPPGVWVLVDPDLAWTDIDPDLVWTDAGSAPIYVA